MRGLASSEESAGDVMGPRAISASSSSPRALIGPSPRALGGAETGSADWPSTALTPDSVSASARVPGVMSATTSSSWSA